MAQEPQTHALYRFFGAGGTLLYIGITNSIPRRLGQHNDDKAWWHGVSRVEIEHYPNRRAVLEAERRAIIAEKPLYNDKHNSQSPTTYGAVDHWAEGYMMVSLAILETFDEERANKFKSEARDLIAAGEPRLANTSLDSAMLLGAAAIIAFKDVHDRMSALEDEVARLSLTIPPEAKRAIAERVADEIASSSDSTDADIPVFFLRHFINTQGSVA